MAQVKDPVCGTSLDPETAPERIEHGSHTHYFCSAACREKFAADPARYGDAHAGELEKHEPPHTTTGILTAPKFGSAGSGGLEYEPGPERHGHGHQGTPGSRE